ncbi:hypothetical protein GCM10027258_57980 [Amycolatopsis stemonae]
MRGTDVHPFYQRGLRWNQVTDIHFAWVKVSDGGAPYTTTQGGVTYRPDTHVAGAKSVGIPVGGYHYAQPSPAPERQADVLLGEVRRLGATGVAPMLDLEAPFKPDATAKAFGLAFCRRVAAAGFRPAVYMSSSWAAVLRPDQWDVPGLVIVIARYGARPEAAGSGRYVGRYDVHQYSSSGSLPGSAGAVDLDESYTNAHLTTQEEPDMDATQAQQLAELHAWLSPLSVETGPKPDGGGDAPRSNPKTIADMLANLYGMMFFPSNYITAPDGSRMPSILSMVAKAAYGSGVDPAAIADAVEKAVGTGLDEFRAQLRADVVSVIGEDNAEQADAIVDKLAARLGTKPAAVQ